MDALVGSYIERMIRGTADAPTILVIVVDGCGLACFSFFRKMETPIYEVRSQSFQWSNIVSVFSLPTVFKIIGDAMISLLVLSSCREEGTKISNPITDQALRSHLGVRSMSGTIEIPEDLPVFVSTYFEIVDGKVQGCGSVQQGFRENVLDAPLQLEVHLG